jgi:heptosyltransferase-2
MSGGEPAIPLDCPALLIAFPSWVGDAVMATAVPAAIAAERPRTALSVAVRPPLQHLLDGLPWPIIVADDRGPLGPWRAARILRRAARPAPVAALLLANSFRRGLTVRLAGVARRVGYARDGRGILLTHAAPAPPRRVPLPLLEAYQRLCASALGGAVRLPPPRLVVTAAQEDRAAALLAGADGPLAVINPGANRADKRWPARCFARLAVELTLRLRLRVAVTGGPGERDLVRSVVAQARSGIPIDLAPIDLVERGVDLASLKGVLRRAAVLVTNDTGPRHIAAALGTPVVTLFGPTDPRWTTLPDAREHLLLAEPFLPAELSADRHPRACAIERITVTDALCAVTRLLRRDP